VRRETLSRKLAAEALGAALLLATVVGSGIMAERLSGGNVALALLGNTLPTGCMLAVLILIFGGTSGAHFNPAVSLVFALRGELSWREMILFVVVQIVGAILGVLLAHIMFELPVWQISAKPRLGLAQGISEFVAAFGLMLTILGCLARAPAATPFAVGLFIAAAYWFTASTSFANPAVTLARALSDTFAGIAPSGVMAFIVAQCLGAVAAALFSRWLWADADNAAAAPPARRNR
jgi:glycerol uptake facilitator-like aquaporin